MTTTTEALVAGTSPMTPTTKTFRPVVFWAVLGAGFLALETYIFTAWIVSGKATPTPTGSTPVPTSLLIMVRSLEVISAVLLAFAVYRFLIRPWRREGRVTLDGLFVIVFLTLYWQDPLIDYSQNWFSYTSVFFNLGSWSTNIPGWIAPRSNLMPEPIFVLACYIYVFFALVVLSNYLMRKAAARWGTGPIGQVGIAFTFLATFTTVVEPLLVRAGFWTYPGAIDSLSIFSGRYAFPLYESVFIALWLTTYACLRQFRDDKGYTVAERGIDSVRVGPRQRTVVRFLALVGVCNVIFLLGYNIPHQFSALNSEAWPAEVIDRSYLTNGLCGPGTTYACPGPDVPIPHGDSLHVDPDGQLVGGEADDPADDPADADDGDG